MATARKPAARKPAVQRASTDVEVGSVALERQVAEVEEYGEYIEYELNGHVFRVKPVMEWPKDVFSAVRIADYDALGDVMHPDDAIVWVDFECTLGECTDFVAGVLGSAGQDQGESRASRRTRQRMQRR